MMEQGYENAEARSFAIAEPVSKVRMVDGRTVVTHGVGLDDVKLRRHLASMTEAATSAQLDQVMAA